MLFHETKCWLQLYVGFELEINVGRIETYLSSAAMWPRDSTMDLQSQTHVCESTLPNCMFSHR